MVVANVITEADSSEEKEKIKKLNFEFQTDPNLARKWPTTELLSFLM